MAVDDVAAVRQVADRVHPELPETASMFANRLQTYKQGCFVLGDAEDVMGYMIAHPILPFEPPALNALLSPPPAEATQFYIHDIALDKRLRGGGHARAGIEILLHCAAAYDTTGLVSVYGTAPFWSRFGFVPAARPMQRQLAAYGQGAVFMTRMNR